MKTKVTTYLAHLMISGLLVFSASTSNDFEKLLASLEKQTYDYVQEKVYLHLDRPYYSLGDDLWFKAYTVAGPNHTPTPLSENLFVELIDPKGKVLKRHTVYMNKGLGKGDFQLADSLKAGAYQIRAYTNWMRNFDEGFFFHKTFNVIYPFDLTNPFDASEENERTTEVAEIRFFPEGGELITGVPGQVVAEWQGAPAGTKADILDGAGAKVVSVTFNEDGLGKFGFLPMKGQQYVLLAEGLKTPIALPKARNNGYVLSVDNLSSEAEVLVTVKTATPGKHLAYLVAHTRGEVGFGSKLDWQGATARLKIPRTDLGNGLTHITLFNSDWKPEAERLIFQNSTAEQVNFEITTDKSVYEQRDMATVKLKLTDLQGQPLQGFFSMNVYDADQISPEAWKDNIVSNMLLTSDLKGEIQNPLKYLGKSKEARANLDLLLMTRGWTRFTWKDLLEEQFPETTYEVEQGFKVTGTVKQRNGQKTLARASIKQIGTFEGIPLFAQAETDAKGSFEMTGLHFYEGEMVLKAKDRKGKSNVQLVVDSTAAHSFPKVLPPAAEVAIFKPAEVTASFTETSKQRQQISIAYDTTGVTDLGTVVVEGKEVDRAFANLQRGIAFGRGEYAVDVSDLMAKGQNFQNALYTVQRVPGVSIVLRANQAEPVVEMNRRVFSIQNPNPPPSFFIDDSPVDISAVTAMPAILIERVEVLKGMKATGLFGPSANGGAILFYTKNREEMDDYLKEFAEFTASEDKSVMGLNSGYYHSREFYTPNYLGEGKKNPKPDYRDLIHWAPMIETDENGEAEVQFFNADLPATIRVQVEGIWEGGIPLSKSVDYVVKR